MHDELNETSISSQADEMPSQPTASYTTRWDSTAAEADAGLSSAARESVLAAHLAICRLKAGA
jgi:hypothetical protein